MSVNLDKPSITYNLVFKPIMNFYSFKSLVFSPRWVTPMI